MNIDTLSEQELEQKEQSPNNDNQYEKLEKELTNKPNINKRTLKNKVKEMEKIENITNEKKDSPDEDEKKEKNVILKEEEELKKNGEESEIKEEEQIKNQNIKLDEENSKHNEDNKKEEEKEEEEEEEEEKEKKKEEEKEEEIVDIVKKDNSESEKENNIIKIDIKETHTKEQKILIKYAENELLKEKGENNQPEQNKYRKEEYIKYIIEAEDSCDKCPLRFLVFIPICFFYLLLSLFDFLTYMIIPVFFCLYYTITFICGSIKRVVSNYQVEEEIGFSGAFTAENDIKLIISKKGGVFNLTEILCFSYMSACFRRYFCFLFVLINHIVVPILQSWNKAKKCFLRSKIEELYDERLKQIEDAQSYKGFDQADTQIEIDDIDNI